MRYAVMTTVVGLVMLFGMSGAAEARPRGGRAVGELRQDHREIRRDRREIQRDERDPQGR